MVAEPGGGASEPSATIFRTLEILTDLKAVERLDLPNGDHSYIRCDPGHHHTSFAQLRSVGGSRGLWNARVAAEVRGGRLSGRPPRVELFGLCPSCQSPDSA